MTTDEKRQAALSEEWRTLRLRELELPEGSADARQVREQMATIKTRIDELDHANNIARASRTGAEIGQFFAQLLERQMEAVCIPAGFSKEVKGGRNNRRGSGRTA